MDVIAANGDAILYAIGLIVAMAIFMPFSPMTIDLLMLPRGAQIWIHRNRRSLWAIVIVCFGIELLRAVAGQADIAELAGIVGSAGETWSLVTVITVGMLVFMFWSGYVPYVMTPPANPKILGVAEADKVLKPDQVVLGVTSDGEARAYPRDTIARPHFFRDEVGGRSLMVSYCILCNSGMAFKPELDGRPLNLSCVTAFNNNIIYLDEDRKNYIQQLDGKVVEGPDVGKTLEQYPVVQTSWAEWKTLHPETKLYHSPSATLRDKMVDLMLRMMIPVPRLARRTKPWHRIRGKLDKRLPAMSFTLGVEIGDDACGYPIDRLKQGQVVNDEVGGEPVVVVHDARVDVSEVYSRRVGDRVLTFEPADNVMQDRETQTRWDISGNAVDGELSGQSLTPIPHYNRIFWFSWALFKPHTRVNEIAQADKGEAKAVA